MYPDQVALRRWEISPEYAAVTRLRMAAFVLTLLCVGYLSFGLENYCYLIPNIDTRYAPECSELKFRLIKIGMTENEVLARIGQPLGRHPYRHPPPGSKVSGDDIWGYTSDGGHAWADFAWLSRQLVMRNGRVVEKVYWTYYD